MDTRQFHKRCFALLLVCALALGCLPRAQAASRSAIESLQSQQPVGSLYALEGLQL